MTGAEKPVDVVGGSKNYVSNESSGVDYSYLTWSMMRR